MSKFPCASPHAHLIDIQVRWLYQYKAQVSHQFYSLWRKLVATSVQKEVHDVLHFDLILDSIKLLSFLTDISLQYGN